MIEGGFERGELFVYVNGDRWELGMVKRPNDTGDGYFCWYSTGDTAANTPTYCMRKLANHGWTRIEGLLRAATNLSVGGGGRMTATEELRCMLDERGVEHYDGTECTLWLKDEQGYRASADELTSGRISLHLWCTTPQQAIDATLGRGEVERLRSVISDSADNAREVVAENVKLRELAAKMAKALRVGSEWCDRECIVAFGCDGMDECLIAKELREFGVEWDR